MFLNFIVLFFISLTCASSATSCNLSRNVTTKEPISINLKSGFFYLHGLSNGESAVMYKIPNHKQLTVQYTFLNSDCNYETYSYDILSNSTLIDETKITTNIDDFLIAKTLSFNDEGSEKKLSYKINKHGFKVDSNIKKSIVALKPSIKQGLYKQNTKEIKASLEDYDFVYEFKLTFLNDGRYFYQTANLPDSIDGAYTFKTSDNKYHSLNYMISRPFNQELGASAFEVGSYTIADEESYYDGQNEIVLVNGEQKRLIYFFDSNGIHIKGFEDDSNFGVNYPHIGMSN